MLRLRRSGPIGSLAPEALERSRRDFAAGRPLLWRGFLEPELLRTAQERVAAIEFGEGQRRELRPSPLAMTLTFLASGRDLLELVGTLAGTPIRSAYGSLYRQLPGKDGDWHTDDLDVAAGLLINISPKRYRGGSFVIKRDGEDAILAEADYSEPGDALLFPIRAGLVHRGLRVVGTEPKYIFACLFDPAGRGRGFSELPRA